jgi:MinD-like ATPase involved in chromosome partitioning or flagellar assembly
VAPDFPADRIRAHFRRRARAVVELPFDPHLASGGPIVVDRLLSATRERFLELAALVVDGLPGAGGVEVPAAAPGAVR